MDSLSGAKRQKPGRPRLRAQLRELAGQAILEAAEAVFCEVGLGASMEAIATRAGVAVGTLYNHFKDRDALFGALVEARRADLLRVVDDSLSETAARPFRERLQALLETMSGALQEHMAFKRLLVQSDLPWSMSKRREFFDKLLARLEDLFRQGHAEHLLQDDPQRRLPSFFIGLLFTALSMTIQSPDRLSFEQLPEVVGEQFLDGARRRPAAAKR